MGFPSLGSIMNRYAWYIFRYVHTKKYENFIFYLNYIKILYTIIRKCKSSAKWVCFLTCNKIEIIKFTLVKVLQKITSFILLASWILHTTLNETTLHRKTTIRWHIQTQLFKRLSVDFTAAFNFPPLSSNCLQSNLKTIICF